MVKSVLENAAIPSFFKNEFAGTLAPLLTDVGGADQG